MTHWMNKMFNIESYVFFDIETTGLPWQEKNQTKITELCLVAVSRKDLVTTKHGESPPVSKLTLVFNPTRPINTDVVLMNGLSNDLLQHAPLFAQKRDTIISFIQGIPKPVCFVAHNGNNFDYKIFLAECKDANFSLPNDLLCVDSLVGFRKLLSSSTNYKKDEKNKVATVQTVDDLITDDEDEWPHLNVSTEEWGDIDKICESLSDISCDEHIAESNDNSTMEKQIKKKVSRKKVIEDVFKKGQRKSKESFTLLDLYKRLVGKEPSNHHRAEEDCLMLLQCVTATMEAFVPWADKACIKLTDIKPLIRY